MSLSDPTLHCPSMIQSFKHKGLAELFKTGSARKVQVKHVARLKMILTLLNAATHAGQLNARGLRLHPLKGKPADATRFGSMRTFV